jgi:hypothetical protein
LGSRSLLNLLLLPNTLLYPLFTSFFELNFGIENCPLGSPVMPTIFNLLSKFESSAYSFCVLQVGQN